MAARLPRVVRIRRRGGKLVQGYDCYIGREFKRGDWNLEASIWENPFKRRKGSSPGSTLADYERYVRNNPVLMHQIPMLEGKTLGCWCKPNPCHGDVLVKLFQEFLEEEEFDLEADIDGEHIDSNTVMQVLDSSKNEVNQTVEGITMGVTYMKRPYVWTISGDHIGRPYREES